MNIIRLLALVFVIVAGADLRAQNIDPNLPPASGSSTTSAAQPMPRLPVAINHKPSTTPPPEELAAPIAKFFAGLKKGDYAATYESFLAGSKLGEQKEKMSFFISKTQEAFGLYGGLTDYELYDNYPVGSNVVMLTYLSRHANQPLRWRFIFYRPQKTWGIVNMGFDDVLLDMLE